MHPNNKTKHYQRPTIRAAARATLCAALIGLTTIANAEIVSRQAPVSIEADSAELQDTLSTYTGNVRVKQGGVTMSGSRLILRRGRGNSFTFTLSGQPAEIRQASEGPNSPAIRGTARRIDYASGTETLELRGDAVIYRGTEKIAGGDIRYSFKDRRTSVNTRNAGGSNGRVKITLQPGSGEDGSEETP